MRRFKIYNMFELFDCCDDEHNGHSQWLCKLTGLEYLSVSFKKVGFGYWHDWYNGQHHALNIGLLRINWGGKPFLKSDAIQR